MIEPKHITLFTRYLTMGGIQRIMVRLANGFAERGHRVDFVLAKGGGAMADELRPDVHVIDLGRKRVWTALPGLLRYLEAASPDVVLSGEDPSNIVATWAKLLSRSSFKCIVSVHQNTSAYADSDQMWYGTYIPPLTSLFYRAADGVVTVSAGIEDDLLHIAPHLEGKTEVIYNPVVDAQVVDQAAEPIEHPWFKDDGSPVVLGVGRLTPQKNFDLLLRAFAQVVKARDARLVILGDGHRRGHLESLCGELGIGEKVDLHGFTSNPYPYMANASLFVLSSNYEGLPTVLVEALACGCPVVSTDCPSGPFEILEGGAWGELVPMHDPDALAEAMLRSLARSHDHDRLRRRGRSFSVDKSVEHYLTYLFREVQ